MFRIKRELKCQAKNDGSLSVTITERMCRLTLRLKAAHRVHCPSDTAS